MIINSFKNRKTSSNILVRKTIHNAIHYSVQVYLHRPMIPITQNPEAEGTQAEAYTGKVQL